MGYTKGIDGEETFQEASTARSEAKTTHKLLFISLFVLMLSIVVNFGMTWYVVDKAHTADVDEHNYLVSPHGDHQRLRVDRSMDQTILTSTLSTEALDRLERLRVTGPAGSVGFRVQAWGRYLTNNSLYGSVVVLYSEVGTIELDGSQMMFTDDVSEAFARAGFETEKVFRRDVDNAHRHKLRTTAAVVGLFTFLEGVDLSQASQQLNHTPANVNDPFANATAVYMRQFEFLRCDYAMCTEAEVEEGEGSVRLPPTSGDSSYHDQFDVSRLYIMRIHEIYSRKVNGKWYGYTEISHSEYTDAVRVHHEIVSTTGDKLGLSHYTQKVARSPNPNGGDPINTYGNKFYCEVGDPNNVTLESFTFKAETDPTAAPTVMSFEGISKFLDGTDCRVYIIHEPSINPFTSTDPTAAKIPYYETNDAVHGDRRMYALHANGKAIFAINSTLTDAAATASEFGTRAEQYISAIDAGITDDAFLTSGFGADNNGGGTCQSYDQPHSLDSILENATLAALDAPPPLAWYRGLAFFSGGWNFTEVQNSPQTRNVRSKPGTCGEGCTQRFPKKGESIYPSNDTAVYHELSRKMLTRRGIRDRRLFDSAEVCNDVEADLIIADYEYAQCTGYDSSCGAYQSWSFGVTVNSPKFPSPGAGPCTVTASGGAALQTSTSCGLSASGEITLGIDCSVGIKGFSVGCDAQIGLEIDNEPSLTGSLSGSCTVPVVSAGIRGELSNIGVLCTNQLEPKFGINAYVKINYFIGSSTTWFQVYGPKTLSLDTPSDDLCGTSRRRRRRAPSRRRRRRRRVCCGL